MGEGVPEDKQEAVRWYTLAVQQGHAWSQCNLGVMYEYGQEVPENNKKQSGYTPLLLNKDMQEHNATWV
jgi:TPR repeat protein